MNENLIKRYLELQEITNSNTENKYLMELSVLDHYFELQTGKLYDKAAKYLKNLGYSKVIDIGCAYGHQSEVFVVNDMDYVGVEMKNWGDFFNNDKFPYIIGQYPFKINSEILNNSAAISVLCLGWNCYLFEEDTFDKQFSALSKDFNDVILYTTQDIATKIENYFDKSYLIEQNLYHFSNKKQKDA